MKKSSNSIFPFLTALGVLICTMAGLFSWTSTMPRMKAKIAAKRNESGLGIQSSRLAQICTKLRGGQPARILSQLASEFNIRNVGLPPDPSSPLVSEEFNVSDENGVCHVYVDDGLLTASFYTNKKALKGFATIN